MSRAIDADALEKEGWKLHRTIQVDKNTSEYQIKPLKKVPTIEPERWIPCSERLPAYGEDVLITTDGYCSIGHILQENDEKQYCWFFSGWYHEPNEVAAWMSLPEPYKEGEG